MKDINQAFNLIPTKKSRNRIVMLPMDTLMAKDGYANDFHIQHYGARAYGGVGTIIVESTAISSEGRIRPNDLGLWNDEQIAPLARVVSIVKKANALIGIQLNHAGAKAETTETKYAPGTKNFTYLDQSKTVLATAEVLEMIKIKFIEAAKRAKQAGFDFIEIHAAHGYFLNELLSKALNEVSNSDDILERGNLLIEIIKEIKTKVDIPIGVRFSFDDYAPEGMITDDYFPLLKEIEGNVSYINASAGSSVAKENINELIEKHGKLYRLPIAKAVKDFTKINVIGLGNISNKQDALEFLKNDIDAIGVGRELLFNPNFALTTLLDVEKIISDDYHWNQNLWFAPVPYLKMMKNLKLK